MRAPETSLRIWHGVLVVAALLATAGSSVAGGSWVAVASDGAAGVSRDGLPRAPHVNVGWYDETGLDLTVDLAGLELSVEATRGGKFLWARWPEAALGGAIGEPTLPVVRKLVVVPQGTTLDLHVAQGRGSVIDLTATGFSDPLMPVQAPIPMVPGALERTPFDFDHAAYAADAFGPGERGQLTELGVLRGWQLYLLEVRPVAYNPVRQALLVWPHIKVGIRFAGWDEAGGARGRLAPLKGVLLNPPPRPTGRGSGNYLIVVAEAYASAITSFADAKTAQGFTVMTYSVPADTSKETIKAYIQSLWGTADAPDYVLLVGDTDTIPYWGGEGPRRAVTDLPYACMDGSDDWYPDIAIGRFAVSSTGQLQAVVNKSLFVEAGDYPDPDYIKRVALLATEDTAAGAEDVHDWVAENYLEPNGYEVNKIYANLGGNTQDVFDAINGGSLFVIYFGHSSSTGWWNPMFRKYEIEDLVNTGLYGLAVGFCCDTSHYEYDECVGEVWIRRANKGAAAYLAPSDKIYWQQTPWHESQNLEKYLFQSFLVDDIWEVSPAWQAALVRFLAHYGPTNITRDHFEMFVLLGDPGLHLPSARAIPGDLNGDGCVDHPDLGILLGDWGCSGGDCPGDADGDGDTDHADLGVLLGHWGEGC